MKPQDKKVLKLVKDLQQQCATFVSTVTGLGNQCAWTDRMVEEIVSTATQLETVYQSQFQK